MKKREILETVSNLILPALTEPAFAKKEKEGLLKAALDNVYEAGRESILSDMRAGFLPPEKSG